MGSTLQGAAACKELQQNFSGTFFDVHLAFDFTPIARCVPTVAVVSQLAPSYEKDFVENPLVLANGYVRRTLQALGWLKANGKYNEENVVENPDEDDDQDFKNKKIIEGPHFKNCNITNVNLGRTD